MTRQWVQDRGACSVQSCWTRQHTHPESKVLSARRTARWQRGQPGAAIKCPRTPCALARQSAPPATREGVASGTWPKGPMMTRQRETPPAGRPKASRRVSGWDVCQSMRSFGSRSGVLNAKSMNMSLRYQPSWGSSVMRPSFASRSQSATALSYPMTSSAHDGTSAGNAS